MKYYNFLFCSLLSAIVAFSSACNDDAGAGNLACFQESGYITTEFSYQDNVFEQTMTVLNRGLGTFNTQITPYTQEEMATYNLERGTNYQVMPEGTYKLSETNLSFADNDKAKDILVTMYPKKLFDVIRKDTETKQYALPLRIGNLSNASAVYVVNMDYPILKLSEEEITLRMIDEEEEVSIIAYTYEEQDATTSVPNKGNVNLDIAIPDNAEEWVKRYNAEHNTAYQLLPSAAFQLSKMVGVEGDKQCMASIKVNRTLSSGEPLEYGKFILPVQLAGIDEYVALNHNISAITVNNPNGYDNIGVEYDDGKNIIFHVKIAIDKEGFELNNNNMDFFVEKIAKQWEEINYRFNRLDKKNILKRNYIFVPDLEDIIVYEHKKIDSNWTVPTDYPERINKDKFQCLVSYDCVIQEDEINRGGGYGQTDYGMGNILVIHPGKENLGIFKNHFEGNNGTESITHELGHFRGLIDTYWCSLSASNNQITGEKFSPERGNMMGACYEPLESIEWSVYEMYVLNATLATKCNIYETMAKYFPDKFELTVTENGKPIEGFKLNIYRKSYSEDIIKKDDIMKHSSNGSSITVDAKVPLFWPHQGWFDKYPHTFNRLILIEVISNKTGKSATKIIPVYEVHKQGLLDKSENQNLGVSVFKTSINIK